MTQVTPTVVTEQIEYRGHTIKLIHRTALNDYAYSIDVTTSIGGQAPRRDAAIAQARKDIDMLGGFDAS